MKQFVICCFIIYLMAENVDCHGRLLIPTSRSSLWRYWPDSPRNYNDNQLFCGGANTQKENGGKCGICGDNYKEKQPRENENGGKYGLGKIAETYIQGQEIEVTVQITAHHKGWFEFNLCKLDNPTELESEECMQKHLLQQPNGETRYQLPDKGSIDYKIKIQLPKDVSCEQCVFRWRYHTGNSWGCDSPNDCGLGKGHQEEFYGCADIRINRSGNQDKTTTKATLRPPVTRTTVSPTDTPTVKSTINSVSSTSATDSHTTRSPTTPACSGSEVPIPNSEASERKQSGEDVDCVADGEYIGQPGITNWCRNNCFAAFPNCAETHCRCFIRPCGGGSSGTDGKIYNMKALAMKKSGENIDCEGTGAFKGRMDMQVWCRNNCFAPSPYCPASHCECFRVSN